MVYFENYKGEDIKNNIIWRYMDIGKFISLLSTSKLYLPSPTELYKIDPFDSILPNLYKSSFQMMDNYMKRGGKETHFTNMEICANYLRGLIGISCWNISNYETYNMWNSYTDKECGVAIRSTVEDLKSSISEKNGDETLIIGKVTYQDKQQADFPSMINESLFFPFYVKRKPYINEKELRIVKSKFSAFKIDEFKGINVSGPIYEKELEKIIKEVNGEYKKTNNEDDTKENSKLTVDLKKLIKEIYVAPNAPEYLVEAIKNVVKEYGYNEKIVKESQLFKQY